MSGGAAPKEHLISGSGVLGLAAAAVVALVWLHGGVRGREQTARDAAPSSISLHYLRLAMEEAPASEAPRRTFVEASLRAGRFDEARDALTPLRTEGAGPALWALHRDLERQAWLATDPTLVDARERARLRYVAAIEQSLAHTDDPEAHAALADEAAQAGDSALAARLRRQRVLRHGRTDDASLEAAAAFPLAHGRPLEAAAVYEAGAAGRKGRSATAAAVRALELALSADQAEAGLALLQRLQPRFGRDDAVLAIGLRLADAAGDGALGLRLAEARLANAPADPARHAAVARRAAWQGDVGRQLDAELWLAEHAPSRAHQAQALRTARAIPDFDAQLRLLGPLPHPFTRDDLTARLELLEALGEVESARDLLVLGLEQGLGDDPSLWEHRVALELSSDRDAQALQALQAMEHRFGESDALSLRQADLMLRLGHERDAVRAVARVRLGPDADHATLAGVGELAFALADAETARQAYQLASERPDATPLDFQRLHDLWQTDGDDVRAWDAAVRGLLRFESWPFFALALADARRLQDETRVQTLIDDTAAPDHPLYYDMRFVALHVGHVQQRAYAARSGGQFAQAGNLLALSSAELARRDVQEVIAQGGEPGSLERQLADLQRAQLREELSVALATGDRAALSRLYLALHDTLSPADRVNILHQLGRDQEAVALGLAALDDGSVDGEGHAQLERDVEYLAAAMPREVFAEGGLDDYGTLQTFWGQVGVRYGSDRWGTRLSLRYDELSAEPGLAQPPDGDHELRLELGGSLRRGAHRLGADLGIDARPGAGTRPYLSLHEASSLGSRGAEVAVRADVNEVADDSAELRGGGMRDSLRLSAYVPFAAPVSLSLSGAAQLWSSRDDRTLVGSGATAEGAVIYHALPRQGAWQLDFSGLARVAPRVPTGQGEGELPMPDGTTWLGSAVALGHGNDRRIALRSRRVSFHLRGALGWLIPQNQAGYYAEGGLAVPLFGGDALTLRARASNAIGNEPGEWMYGASAGYTLSLW